MISFRRFATLVVPALAVVAASAVPAAAKEVVVDCTKASIQDALGDKAPDLTIVVKGWCNEHVVILRPVVLRGFSGDPSLDGIEGPGRLPGHACAQPTDEKLSRGPITR